MCDSTIVEVSKINLLGKIYFYFYTGEAGYQTE